ncbi:MAG: methionyl-tRNA formyltransferase, partial [Thermoguttaceae bacterium]
MRLLLIGTGPFAAPTFKQLYGTDHEIVTLVTSPLRVSRGKEQLSANIVREIAMQHSTPIFDPDDVNLPESVAKLGQFRADLLVVCDYGQILSPATLASAALGGINLHASLLPKYRGAAPINWAIYHGEAKTGVTIIHMTPEVDAGPCIAQAETDIKPDETAVELEARLAELGSDLVLRTIDLIGTEKLKPIPQNPALISLAPRLQKTDGLIDWNRSAEDIKNQVRAMEPWPRNYTFWHRQNGPALRLIFGRVAVEDRGEDSPPGTVLEAEKDRLLIAAGQ